MEIIKFAEFYAMEAFVFGVAGVTLLAGLYQFIRGKVGGYVPTASHEAR